jgi:hypothetical protein
MDQIITSLISAIMGMLGKRVASDVYDILKNRLLIILGKDFNPRISYYIFAKHSEKCLDATWGTGDGTTIIQWSYHGQNNQKWKIIPVDKDFFFILSQNSKKCIDVAGHETRDGAIIHQWFFHGEDNQLWKFVQASEGFYYIISKDSGKCLDVSDWSKEDGARIHLWSLHGDKNQQWAIVPEIK